MDSKVFSIAEDHPPREGMTISTAEKMSGSTSVTYFSLGKGTDISTESYASTVIYIGCAGSGVFKVGHRLKSMNLSRGEMMTIKENTLCGISTEDGFVYTEIMPQKEINMNNAVKPGEVFTLSELVPYEKGSIVNMDVASNAKMKFVVMAFDEGTMLSPHRAPGDALIFALEGKAVISYEGKEHIISAGENFRFEKNGLHSVKADGRFKMALLITLE